MPPRISRLFRLDGKVAVVTGGSKGLGLAMAEGLAEHGADVVLCSRHEEECQAAARQLIHDYDRRARGMGCDVADAAQVDRLVQEVRDTFGRIDILVNSAGINIRGAIDELTLDEFRQVQQVNVEGVWLTSRAVVPLMKESGGGRIINIASTLGMVGLANRTPYATSKGAVIQLTRALALELAPHGVLCNAICPGPFLTDMNIPIAETEEAKKFIVGAVPLNRWGELDEIKGAAIYLASDAASYVTGSLLAVDGGWTCH
jgi:NAD(P)-dependent dehydrogenase (short-subunit alcohol dehydrogenase family)